MHKMVPDTLQKCAMVLKFADGKKVCRIDEGWIMYEASNEVTGAPAKTYPTFVNLRYNHH